MCVCVGTQGTAALAPMTRTVPTGSGCRLTVARRRGIAGAVPEDQANQTMILAVRWGLSAGHAPNQILSLKGVAVAPQGGPTASPRPPPQGPPPRDLPANQSLRLKRPTVAQKATETVVSAVVGAAISVFTHTLLPAACGYTHTLSPFSFSDLLLIDHCFVLETSVCVWGGVVLSVCLFGIWLGW